MMTNDITGVDMFTFTYDTPKPYDKGTLSKELVPNGGNIKVNEGNKKEYVKLLCYAKRALNIEK